jgi:spore coat protein U-like protein
MRWFLIAGFGILAATSPAAASLLNATCSLSATALAFGIYAPGARSADMASGSVTVTCTALLAVSGSYQLTASTGNAGTYTARQMSGTPTTLAYQLYTNASDSVVWGDGSGGTGVISGSFPLFILSSSQTLQFYGAIPPEQNIDAGSYSDVIIVTIEY